MKKILIILAVSVFLAGSVSSVYAVEAFTLKTELRQYDPDRAYNGYTTWAAGGTAWLIDMEGNLVHTWAGGSYKLLDNGNNYGQIFEMDWDGNYVWGPYELPADRPDLDRLHHDNWKIFNKILNKYTHISLVNQTVTNAEIYAAGGDPAIDYEPTLRNTRHDVIIEIDPDTGQIIWQWRFLDHTVQDRNAAWPRYGVIADNPGKLDIFHMTDQEQPDGNEGVARDWHHCNSINYNEALDYIAVNAKHWSEFYVIDHGATFVSDAAAFAADSVAAAQANFDAAASDAGDYLYRFGNPSAYQQGAPPKFEDEGNQQMYGSHNIQWIQETDFAGGHSLPGAGNFLIFNNDCYDPLDNRSEILEITPYLDAAGVDNFPNYVNPPDAGYASNGDSRQIVWSYKSQETNTFYSNYISGCQRLPNGNTHINAGRFGHFFEVTPQGDVVWEYINPVTSNIGIVKYLSDGNRNANSTFRSMRWAPDHPAFAGKDLSPLGPITESTVSGAMDKFRESKTGFAGTVVIIPGGGGGYSPY